MPNKDGKNQGPGYGFDEDTDEAIVLPPPVPEVTADDEKKADAAFDDLEIVVDDDEVRSESENQPSGRKY
jgi:hypothetical protein